MGLDLKAYEFVTLEQEEPEGGFSGEDFEENRAAGLVYLYDHPHFPDRSDTLPSGFYLTSGKTLGGGLSYSGYNVFREHLCMATLGVMPSAVWGDYGQYVGRPFASLVNFSDCEGTLGPVTCANLAADLDEVERKVDDYLSSDYHFYLPFWNDLKAMIRIAAGSGAIKFA